MVAVTAKVWNLLPASDGWYRSWDAAGAYSGFNCNVGNTVASGVVTGFKRSLSTQKGNAVCAGTTCTIVSGGTVVLWTDSIQSGSQPWGFDYTMTEHPIGSSVSPADANGANLSRVANPISGGGYALRLYGLLDSNGARSELDILSQVNSTFNSQAKSAEGIWVAQQWYFPSALDAGSDDYPWINLWDWHSTNSSDRWHTSPGLMPAKDGTMRLQFVWGGGSASYNTTSGYSSSGMPVGSWFDIEMHYAWTATNTATISLWFNGSLVLQQTNCRTRASAHTNVEMNTKLYGTDQGRTAWTPSPTIRYIRNIRFAGSKIT